MGKHISSVSVQEGGDFLFFTMVGVEVVYHDDGLVYFWRLIVL
jgi:hypothetical protein